LVVDDNEMNRDMLARRLQREGYSVETSEDGYQALDRIRQERFDVVLLDIMMPGISGLDILTMIRAQRSLVDLPVILTTAKTQSEEIVEGLSLGANDYVTKPIDLPVLLARIRTHLQLRDLSQLKDEFLRIASHDLKNPLSTVLMSAYILRERLPPGSTMQERSYEILEFIVKHGEEMQGIIRDFLDFQAAQDGKLVLTRDVFQLNDVARTVIKQNTTYASSKQITLSAELDEMLPPINADESRVRQVMQNLVGNAIKFCSKGDSVIVRTKLSTDAVRLEVCDSGPGLTENDLQHIFERYARLSNKPTAGESSTGLGLTICKQMIELHGGQIGVVNNSPKGATFWFSLPLDIPVLKA